MGRLAADYSAKADDGGESLRLREQFCRQRQLKSPGHLINAHAIGADAMILQPPHTPGQQLMDDLLVEARGRDGNAGLAGDFARFERGCLGAHAISVEADCPPINERPCGWWRGGWWIWSSDEWLVWADRACRKLSAAPTQRHWWLFRSSAPARWRVCAAAW